MLGDLLEIFQISPTAKMQRNDLILSHVFTCRDIALRKIGLMKDGPYPHKREAKRDGSSSLSETGEEPRTRTTTNSLVTNDDEK